MIRRAVVAIIALASSIAHAQAPAATADDHLAQVRVLYDKGDFVHARDELQAAYALDPRPELLFALGQVELNLGHYQAAIDDYQQFIATGPAPEQAALAQQAIGAARARLADKPAPPPPAAPPPPPPPALHRAWDRTDTVLAATGGGVALAGAGLLIYSHVLTENHRGTLHEYNDRFEHAAIAQWIGIASVASGVIVAGVAVLRWRLHLVGGEVQPTASTTTAGITWTRPW